MAKGNQKGNREVRKPKAEKSKPPASQASPVRGACGVDAGTEDRRQEGALMRHVA